MPDLDIDAEPRHPAIMDFGLIITTLVFSLAVAWAFRAAARRAAADSRHSSPVSFLGGGGDGGGGGGGCGDGGDSGS